MQNKAGFCREAHLRQNLYFHKDDQGNPIWKDTYVYAQLATQPDRMRPTSCPRYRWRLSHD